MNIHVPGPTPEFNQMLFRRSIEEEVERLIAVLDVLDGDTDIESGADDEPSPGLAERPRRAGAFGGDGGDDREGDDPDFEDDGTLEPLLGALERHVTVTKSWSDDYRDRSGDQSSWGYGDTRVCVDECEEENEHGGDILDQPHDGDADEPELGWPESSAGRGALGLVGTIEEDREIDDADLEPEHPNEPNWSYGDGGPLFADDVVRL